MEYAIELSADDRARERAMWYLRRAHRRRQDDSPIIHAMAELQWRGGDREQAISYFRFAACLSDTRELYSQSYFTACRWAGQTETALDFLRNRVALSVHRSSLPAMSLFVALETLERVAEGFAVLDEARGRRPADGNLLLLTARKRFQHGYRSDAELLLAEAKGEVKHTEWLAAAAEQASWRGDRAEALTLWQEVVEVEPLNLDAHGMIAQLLSESRSREAALTHLRSVCNTFPHHLGLHYLLYTWTQGDAAAEREAVLRHMVEVDPADAWTHRELAMNLTRQSRFEEAERAADEALALDARTAAGFTIKGDVLVRIGKPHEATECYRSAVRSWADAPGAIHGLLGTHGDTPEKRKEVLEFVESELLKQAAVGDGFLTFREVARAVLTPTELLRSLEKAHRMRPDLWQVWSVLSQHQAEMGLLDDALLISRQATERFPRLPRVWLDLSIVHQLRLESQEQIDALTRCRELNPDWPSPTLFLSTALENQGRRNEAIKILEAAVTRLPLEVSLRGQLANLHYRDGDLDRAVAVATEAVTINPEYDQGWYALLEWCSVRGKNQGPLEMLRQLAESRPGEYMPWIRLAEFNAEFGELDAAIQSVDRAIAIDPRASMGHDLKAHLLTRQRRYRDAEAACAPEVFGDSPPSVLQGRAAWVDAQRGDYTAAIERMRHLVKANPDYEWGLQQLMEWYAETGKHMQAMETAQRLAWLDPTNMVPQGWLGQMKWRLGDLKGAKTVLRRAMEFQPTYLFAGFEYFAIQRAEGDFEEAERTLKILALHAKEEDLLAARVQLETSKGNRDGALESLGQLCRLPEANADALERAAAAITERHWHRYLQRSLKRLMRKPGWHAAVPAIWAGSHADKGRFGSPLRYRYLIRLGEPGKAAVRRVLGALGDQGNSISKYENPLKYLRFRWHVRVIRWICRSWWDDDEYWGSVGYALVCLGRYRSTIRWMSGWQSRTNAQSWMLHGLTIALLEKRKDRQAREALRFVSGELAYTEPVAPYLKVWCALGAILDEDWDRARQMLHQAPPDALKKHEQKLRKFASVALTALTAVGSAESLSRKDENAIQRVVTQFAGTGAPFRLANLVLYKVARHAGRTWTAVRAWSRLYLAHIPRLIFAAAVALLLLWLLAMPG
jgi:tetratricopeptide (TPR) repeat protein